MDAHSISGSELVELYNSSQKCLIIDCRSFLVYNKGHIISAVNVRSNSIMRRRNKGAFSLENAITSGDKRSDFLSGIYSAVVVYDDQGSNYKKEENSVISPKRTMSMVIDVLQKNSPQNTEITHLNCGYKTFTSEYPEVCEGFVKDSLSLETENACTTPSTLMTPIYDQGNPVEILPHLFLGSAHHASQKSQLQSFGITALMNASSKCPNLFEPDFRYKRIPVEDNCQADISLWFKEAINFINDEKEKGGKVLVHCHAGVSRSATICLAYLIACCGVSLTDAFRYVKHRRNVISPNFNFMGQLMKFESDVYSEKDQTQNNNFCAIKIAQAEEEMECQNENLQKNFLAPKLALTHQWKLLNRRRAVTALAPLNNNTAADCLKAGCQTAPPKPDNFSFFPESSRSCSSHHSEFVSPHTRHSRAVTLST